MIINTTQKGSPHDEQQEFMMKMSLDFEHAWLDIYYTFEDNAFDQSKVFHAKDGSILIGDSVFVEVPFRGPTGTRW